MAKGIPTRLEALAFTKAGSFPDGSTIRGGITSFNDGGGFPGFVELTSADGVNPMIGTIYNPNSSLTLTVLLGTAGTTDDSIPSTFKQIMGIGPGKREPFIIGPGWYLIAYFNDATGGTFAVTYQGGTLSLHSTI